jgi:hypothetical protein
MPTTEHAWQFTAITVRATLDERALTAKQGIRTFRVAIPELRHLYIEPTGAGQYENLLLVTEPSPGKKKVVRLPANAGQPAFRALADAIVALRPDVDRRGMPLLEARKLMGVKDAEAAVLFWVLGLVMAILAVVVSPALVHGLDRGEQKITAAKLLKHPELESRNLVVTKGELALDQTVQTVTVTKRNGIETGRTIQYYIPLFAEGEEGRTVKLLVRTKSLGSSELDALSEATSYHLMLRNVLWEGLSGSTRSIVDKHIRGKLADDVWLLELDRTPDEELTIFGLVVGIGTGVLGLVMVLVWRQKKKRERMA